MSRLSVCCNKTATSDSIAWGKYNPINFMWLWNNRPYLKRLELITSMHSLFCHAINQTWDCWNLSKPKWKIHSASMQKSQVFSEEYFRHFKSHVFIQILPILATIACPDFRRPDRNHGFIIFAIDPFKLNFLTFLFSLRWLSFQINPQS